MVASSLPVIHLKRTRRRHSPATPLINIMLLHASPQLQSHEPERIIYCHIVTDWAVSMAVTYCHIGWRRYTGAMNVILSYVLRSLIGAIDRYNPQYRYVPLSSKGSTNSTLKWMFSSASLTAFSICSRKAVRLARLVLQLQGNCKQQGVSWYRFRAPRAQRASSFLPRLARIGLSPSLCWSLIGVLNKKVTWLMTKFNTCLRPTQQPYDRHPTTRFIGSAPITINYVKGWWHIVHILRYAERTSIIDWWMFRGFCMHYISLACDLYASGFTSILDFTRNVSFSCLHTPLWI